MGIGGKSTSADGEGAESKPFNLDDYAAGEIIDGIPEFYDIPAEEVARQDALTWPALLAQWALIEPDLHQFYGIDADSGILAARTGRWLRVKIRGLLLIESRLRAHVADKHKPSPEGS